MQQIRNARQNKKASELERFFIWNPKMVREVDYRWNQFYPSLYLLYSKLEKVGLAFVNGKVIYLSDKELGDV